MGKALSALVESRGQGGTSSAPVVSAEMVNAEPVAVAAGDFPADLHGIRRRLPDEWAAFLRAHFNGNVRLIRAFFGCDEKTARDWLSGKHGVNGAPLLMLIRGDARARAFFMRDAA